jgi:8-oxo-dGTP diphosphatase
MVQKKGSRKKKSLVRFVRIVEVLAKDSKGRFLVLKRSNHNSLYIGKWQFPGGKAKKNESAVSAIRREVFEETGCKCSGLKLVKKIVFSEEFRGKESVVELNIFSCRIKRFVCLSSAHSSFKFINSSNVISGVLAPISKKVFFSE